METRGKLMIAFCNKCNKYTNFGVKELTIKAGDNGYCKSRSCVCGECGYAPLFPPKEKEDGVKGN